MILSCGCPHPGQDRLYGKSKRVHNPTSKENMARCTGCRTERSIK